MTRCIRHRPAYIWDLTTLGSEMDRLSFYAFALMALILVASVSGLVVIYLGHHWPKRQRPRLMRGQWLRSALTWGAPS